jgi:hypothetical protein
MKERYCIVTIDTIAELLKDYVADPADIPPDAMPISLQINPTSKKLAIEFESDHFPPDAAPLNVSFKLKRLFGVS